MPDLTSLPERSGATLDISTHGLIRRDRQLIVRVPIAAALTAAYCWFLLGSNHPQLGLAFVGASLLLFAIVGVFLASRWSTRRIRLTPDSVTIWLPLRRVSMPWAKLTPGGAPARNGLWGLFWRRPNDNPGVYTPFSLTIEQARAVLAYPYRPRWEIPEPVLESLGLSPVATSRPR